MNDMMDEVIGQVEVELDGRFSRIRTKETNLGKRNHIICDHVILILPH